MILTIKCSITTFLFEIFWWFSWIFEINFIVLSKSLGTSFWILPYSVQVFGHIPMHHAPWEHWTAWSYSNKSSFPVQCNFAFKIFVWSTWNVLHSHYSQAFHQAELRFTGVLHGLLVWICDALRFSYFVKPLWFYNTMGQLLKFRDLLVLYKFMSRIILYYKHCERCIFFENCIWYTLWKYFY